MRKINLLMLSAMFVLFTSQDAIAQSRPAVHWLTFADEAVAEVVCSLGNRQIRLSAYSSDSLSYGRIRDNVRAKIVRSALFDTCS